MIRNILVEIVFIAKKLSCESCGYRVPALLFKYKMINKLNIKLEYKQNLVHSLSGRRKSEPCEHEVYEMKV